MSFFSYNRTIQSIVDEWIILNHALIYSNVRILQSCGWEKKLKGPLLNHQVGGMAIWKQSTKDQSQKSRRTKYGDSWRFLLFFLQYSLFDFMIPLGFQRSYREKPIPNWLLCGKKNFFSILESWRRRRFKFRSLSSILDTKQ